VENTYQTPDELRQTVADAFDRLIESYGDKKRKFLDKELFEAQVEQLLIQDAAYNSAKNAESRKSRHTQLLYSSNDYQTLQEAFVEADIAHFQAIKTVEFLNFEMDLLPFSFFETGEE
jgi:hypothetical protein